MQSPGFLLRISLLSLRLLQWASAVIVMGISSYFIAKYDSVGLVIYHEVIAVLSVAFFLPGLISPFMPKFGFVSIAIDGIFSYLWLTSFILMSREYRGNLCTINAPVGGKCSLKRTSQAFSFIAFFCCLASAGLEVRSLWNHSAEGHGRRGFHDKEASRPSADTGVTGTTAGEPIV